MTEINKHQSRVGRDLLMIETLMAMSPALPAKSVQKDLETILVVSELREMYDEDPKNAIIQLYTKRTMASISREDLAGSVDLITKGPQKMGETIACMRTVSKSFPNQPVFADSEIDQNAIYLLLWASPDQDTLFVTHVLWNEEAREFVDQQTETPVSISQRSDGAVTVAFKGQNGLGSLFKTPTTRPEKDAEPEMGV